MLVASRTFDPCICAFVKRMRCFLLVAMFGGNLWWPAQHSVTARLVLSSRGDGEQDGAEYTLMNARDQPPPELLTAMRCFMWFTVALQVVVAAAPALAVLCKTGDDSEISDIAPSMGRHSGIIFGVWLILKAIRCVSGVSGCAILDKISDGVMFGVVLSLLSLVGGMILIGAVEHRSRVAPLNSLNTEVEPRSSTPGRSAGLAVGFGGCVGYGCLCAPCLFLLFELDKRIIEQYLQFVDARESSSPPVLDNRFAPPRKTVDV